MVSNKIFGEESKKKSLENIAFQGILVEVAGFESRASTVLSHPAALNAV